MLADVEIGRAATVIDEPWIRLPRVVRFEDAEEPVKHWSEYLTRRPDPRTPYHRSDWHTRQSILPQDREEPDGRIRQGLMSDYGAD